MDRRQRVPQQWLIANGALTSAARRAVRRLPLGSGVLLLQPLSAGERRWLHHVAGLRRLIIREERGGSAARVHNLGELRHALTARTCLILISPLYATSSHRDWRPLPRMRAATLARLTQRRAIALGGMDAKRYAKIARLGFIAWAAISAFRT